MSFRLALLPLALAATLAAGPASAAPAEQDAPFSVLGIALGSHRADAAPLLAQGGCVEEAGATDCPAAADATLLGARLQSVRLTWDAAGEQVAGIELVTRPLSAFGPGTVEDGWELDGRCLDGDSASLLLAASHGDGDDTLARLQAADVLPREPGDFFCMDEAGQALSVEGGGITRTLQISARLFTADAALRQRFERFLPRLQAATEAARQAMTRRLARHNALSRPALGASAPQAAATRATGL